MCVNMISIYRPEMLWSSLQHGFMVMLDQVWDEYIA